MDRRSCSQILQLCCKHRALHPAFTLLHALHQCSSALAGCCSENLASSASLSWLEQFRGLRSLAFHEQQQQIAKKEEGKTALLRWRQLPPVRRRSDEKQPGGWKIAKCWTALRWLKECCPGLPHSLVHKLFRQRKVRVGLQHIDDGKEPFESSSTTCVSAKDSLEEGSVLHIPASVECHGHDNDRKARAVQKYKQIPSTQELNWLRSIVLYKDADLIVINKPHGLAVQGGTSVGKNLDSLMDAALSYDYREGPRLVHRLDKDTSGLMVLGRTQQSTLALHELLRAKTATASSNIELNATDNKFFKRSYWALVIGTPQRKQGLIAAPLMKGVGEDRKFEKTKIADDKFDSKFMEAITEYEVMGPSIFGCTWLELRPLTGRKHQLRVHCAEALGTPIIGDRKYGWQINRDWLKQFCVETKRLTAIITKSLATDLEGQSIARSIKGSILSEKPLLHLHCRLLRLPKPGCALEAMEMKDNDASFLEFVAPLPPHMEKSWSLQPVPGIVVSQHERFRQGTHSCQLTGVS